MSVEQADIPPRLECLLSPCLFRPRSSIHQTPLPCEVVAALPNGPMHEEAKALFEGIEKLYEIVEPSSRERGRASMSMVRRFKRNIAEYKERKEQEAAPPLAPRTQRTRSRAFPTSTRSVYGHRPLQRSRSKSLTRARSRSGSWRRPLRSPQRPSCANTSRSSPRRSRSPHRSPPPLVRRSGSRSSARRTKSRKSPRDEARSGSGRSASRASQGGGGTGRSHPEGSRSRPPGTRRRSRSHSARKLQRSPAEPSSTVRPGRTLMARPLQSERTRSAFPSASH